MEIDISLLEIPSGVSWCRKLSGGALLDLRKLENL